MRFPHFGKVVAPLFGEGVGPASRVRRRPLSKKWVWHLLGMNLFPPNHVTSLIHFGNLVYPPKPCDEFDTFWEFSLSPQNMWRVWYPFGNLTLLLLRSEASVSYLYVRTYLCIPDECSNIYARYSWESKILNEKNYIYFHFFFKHTAL